MIQVLTFLWNFSSIQATFACPICKIISISSFWYKVLQYETDLCKVLNIFQYKTLYNYNIGYSFLHPILNSKSLKRTVFKRGPLNESNTTKELWQQLQHSSCSVHGSSHIHTGSKFSYWTIVIKFDRTACGILAVVQCGWISLLVIFSQALHNEAARNSFIDTLLDTEIEDIIQIEDIIIDHSFNLVRESSSNAWPT